MLCRLRAVARRSLLAPRRARRRPRRGSTSRSAPTSTWSRSTRALLGPGFKAHAPDVELNVVGTGTGEPASRAIYTKIKAQADAGRKPWDLDVALVSMAVASQMVKEGLLLRYVPQMKNAALVKGAEVKEAFGVNVDGYVVPMFHNQIAHRLSPVEGRQPAEVLRRARRVGEGQPGPLRLQRHQGRRVAASASPWAGCTGRPASTSS